jgi:hypothetical protein
MEPLRTLKQCLMDTELTHLRIIARLWGLEVKATRHLEIAAELARSLADPAHAAETWEHLSDNERAAMQAVLSAGGMMPAAAFRRRFGEIRPIGPGRLEREAPWRNPISPAEGLWYRGLIFEGFAGQARETYSVYFIPTELRSALPFMAEPDTPSLDLKPVSAPTPRFVGGYLLLDDMTTVLAFIHNEVVHPPSKDVANWPDSAKRALVRYLRDPDADRLDFIIHVIGQLGWTRMSDDGRLRLVAEPMLAWLQKPDAASLDVLVGAWRLMKDWDELWRLTQLQSDGADTRHSDPCLAREAFMRHLDLLESDEWVRVDDFIAAIKAVDPDFLRPSGDYDEWYVRDASSGAFLTGFESWDQVEGAVLRAMLLGPAWWLDLVELGGETAADSPEIFLPQSRMGTRPETSVTSAAQTVVRANLSVTIPAHLRLERFQLARVADLAVAGDEYVFRLTPASLQRARRQRIDLEKVLGFLDGLTAAPLSKSVSSSLERWNDRGTEVWLEQTTLLRVKDEQVMQQILKSPKASRYIGPVQSPTIALVAEKDWPNLVSSLAELGFLAELIGLHDS